MPLLGLATELLLQILYCCTSVQDVLALASTCHRLSRALSSHRLAILYRAAEAQIGPLPDAIRVITYNASQPVHLPRPLPPESLALLQRLLAIGRIANRLADIYPLQKWRGSASHDRRLLTSTEAHRLRQALYRLWLYSLAFHNPEHRRRERLQPPVVRSRAALLRAWNNGELAEMLDVHNILRSLVAFYICPSNGTVLRRHRERYPDQQTPPIITVRDYEGTLIRRQCSPCHLTYHNGAQSGYGRVYGTSNHGDGWRVLQGWGDEICHYYTVEDMLKLEPGHIVRLYDYITVPTPRLELGFSPRAINDNYRIREDTHTQSVELKDEIDAVVTDDWFHNNGETFVETMEFVIGERGEPDDMALLKQAIEEGEEGVVRGAFW